MSGARALPAFEHPRPPNARAATAPDGRAATPPARTATAPDARSTAVATPAVAAPAPTGPAVTGPAVTASASGPDQYAGTGCAGVPRDAGGAACPPRADRGGAVPAAGPPEVCP
ncbi:hypothetical protein GCM10010360_13250 [Streptomyces nogalater]